MSLHFTPIITAAGYSDIGCKRQLNEDHYCIDDELGLLMVADGMGGHEAGEVASWQALHRIYEYLHEHMTRCPRFSSPVPQIAEDAVLYANETLYNLNEKNGHHGKRGMGTTIAGSWVLRPLNQVIIFHVGDSRVYLHRSNQIRQLTKDHSAYQRWLDRGQRGPQPSRSILTRGLGLMKRIPVDITVQPLQKDDALLLCSDGLSSIVSDHDIQNCLTQAPHHPESLICQDLIQQSIRQGSRDNITVVMGRYL